MEKLSYVYIFLQSSTIEVFVYFLFYRKLKAFGATFVLTTLANTLTHPVVFFVIMASRLSYIEAILLAEGFAFVAETFLHAYFGKLPLKTTWKASLTANLVSWQLAPILTYLLFIN
ncbi:hypothetical protein [Bdellovibrio sp. KM01]|uniref:hypothetical protein n=1 Tax=Bdellovibrio sp. KM01 TaxID=2748865 RepID=UPI0015EA2A24|nr:hypothetical protein [Bdellovibrio sp. KM01]QLY24053.1 hypothetical protein HW988_11260 [Bdellovibrio sp. KM01]